MLTSKQLSRFRVGVLICGMFLSTPSKAQDDIQSLRAEITRMRAEYESKIQQLEDRLTRLATAQEQTSKSTENAVQLATSNRKLLAEYATTPRYDAIQAPLEGYAKGFEFHGYLRSGFGLNERGDKPQTFRTPFALGRYRLGNEPDTYGEFIFVQNWLNPENNKDKAWFKTEVMIQAMLGGPENFDQPTDLRVREAFAEAGNLLPGRWRATKFWAGSRYYLRQDIHTLDYFFRDMSGIGGGIQEIPVGAATMDVSYIGSTHPTSSFLQSNPPKSTIDFRLAKIKVPGGRGAVWYDYAFSKVNQVVNGVTLPSADGHAFGIEHRRDELLGGYNLVTVQAGTGAAANLTPTTQDPTPFWQQSRRYIVTDHALMQWNEKFSIMPSVVLGWYHTGVPRTKYVQWNAFGVRPVYYFNKNFSIASEIGLQYSGVFDGAHGGWLRTFSIAPQIAPAADFFSRPVLRAFVTYANWSDALKGYIGGPLYANRRSGLAAGLQVETWW